MSSARDFEKLRGTAEQKLMLEIRKLGKLCAKDAPNTRTVSNLLAEVDRCFDALVDSHVAYVQKTNSDLSERRHAEYLERHSDSVDEIKETAAIIVGTHDGNGAPVDPPPDVDNMKEVHASLF